MVSKSYVYIIASITRTKNIGKAAQNLWKYFFSFFIYCVNWIIIYIWSCDEPKLKKYIHVYNNAYNVYRTYWNCIYMVLWKYYKRTEAIINIENNRAIKKGGVVGRNIAHQMFISWGSWFSLLNPTVSHIKAVSGHLLVCAASDSDNRQLAPSPLPRIASRGLGSLSN